jgi:hypothetical protein
MDAFERVLTFCAYVGPVAAYLMGFAYLVGWW